VRESDLRVLFDRQAATELEPAPINIPAARRIGRARLLRRRVVAYGSPVLAAAAVLAIVLGVFVAGPGQLPASGGAPAQFNPLVPYAAVGWYPFRPAVVGASDWRTALLLRASGDASQATEVILYAAGQCTLLDARLSCGSTVAQNMTVMTVSGRAPDVRGRTAYWTRRSGGNLGQLRAIAGVRRLLAFQYASGGWGVVESTGTEADLLNVAGSMRYGQTTALRFPFRLTGLPSVWSDVLFAAYTEPGPGGHGPIGHTVFLGQDSAPPATAVRDGLTVMVGSQAAPTPKCQIRQVTAGGKAGRAKDVRCPSMRTINGYRVYLNTPPVPHEETLVAPNVDGLYVFERTASTGAPLSPSSVLAGHLHLLGPDPAHWTTSPLAP
jgi:hypothetical protein